MLHSCHLLTLKESVCRSLDRDVNWSSLRGNRHLMCRLKISFVIQDIHSAKLECVVFIKVAIPQTAISIKLIYPAAKAAFSDFEKPFLFSDLTALAVKSKNKIGFLKFTRLPGPGCSKHR